MNKEKIAGAIGLVRRTGKITQGPTLVCEMLHRRRAALVLIAADTGPNTEKKVTALAGHKNVPVYRVPLTKEEMGRCLGKDSQVVCVSIPEEFKNLVLASL